MSYLKRRVKKIEEKLNIGDDRTGVFVIINECDADKLPEPLEEWITYKQAKAKRGGRGTVHIAILNLDAELEAREKQQKATKGQGNE